jgi:flagellin-like protein
MSGASSFRGGSRRQGPWTVRRRFRRARRGVSDVVATILLLALTVTLFAAIFAFVTTFPSPPAQNTNQFQASLVYASNNTNYISSLKILHLAGPAISGNGLVFLKSANYPSSPEFQNPIPVAWGINNVSTWNLGQTWVWNFPSHNLPFWQDNITVYLVYSAQLLYSVVLPGQIIGFPPTIVSTWVVPSAPTIGAAFKVYATISGNLGSHKAFINLGGIPGLSTSTVPMWFNSSLSAWQYNVSSGNTSGTPAGTYSAVVNVTGNSGQTATAAVTVTIVSSSGTFSTLSVTPSVQPSPPFVRLPETLVATVTNSGPTPATISSVSFWVNVTAPVSPVVGPISGTVTQPTVKAYSSVTVLSSSTWLPASVNVYNLTARVVFTTGTAVVQWNSQINVGQAFVASVAASPPVVPKSVNSTMVITLTNFGPLTGTTANITVYVNKTATSTGEGTFPPRTITGKGWATPTAGTALGAYSTLTPTLIWTAPSSGGIACTITVVIILTNSAWSSAYAFSVTGSVTG